MKTKARLVAKSVRLKQWSQQIRECQNRPAVLTMDDWCRRQGITKANYYYRLRRLRQAIPDYSAEENSNRKQIPDFPYDRNTLFLFCGRRCDRIKALLWEGDGFLLMYKRLDNGAFNWPRSKAEAVSISQDQFQMLMQGLEIIAKHPILEMADPPKAM